MTQATKWLLVIPVVLLLLSADYAKAGGFIDEISFGVGEEKNDDIDIYRLGLKKDFGCQFLANKTGWVSGYFDMGEGDVLGVGAHPGERSTVGGIPLLHA